MLFFMSGSRYLEALTSRADFYSLEINISNRMYWMDKFDCRTICPAYIHILLLIFNCAHRINVWVFRQ